jgi:hypothetical protein
MIHSATLTFSPFLTLGILVRMAELNHLHAAVTIPILDRNEMKCQIFLVFINRRSDVRLESGSQENAVLLGPPI